MLSLADKLADVIVARMPDLIREAIKSGQSDFQALLLLELGQLEGFSTPTYAFVHSNRGGVRCV